MAQARPQSQGIRIAALVAFKLVACLLSTSDVDTKVGLVIEHLDSPKLIVHTPKACLIKSQLATLKMKKNLTQISIFCLLCDQLRSLRTDLSLSIEVNAVCMLKDATSDAGCVENIETSDLVS